MTTSCTCDPYSAALGGSLVEQGPHRETGGPARFLIVDPAMGVPDIDPLDAEAVWACADLAERAGATGFRIGHTDPDDGPVTWFCAAEYGADAITASGHPDPALAAMALAQRILTGGKCRCGRLVALSVSGALAPPESATMLDGSDPRALRDAGQCLWMLEGRRWEPGCDAPPLTMPADARGKVPWPDPGE